MNMTEAEAKGYERLVDEMARLIALPDLTPDQAERWASLAGTRLALYSEPDGWMRKAVPAQGGRYQLVPMPGPATLLRRQAEARMTEGTGQQ